MHTGPSGLYSVFLPIHLAAHPTNSVRTPTKSTYIHIRLPTTPFGLRPYLSTISVWTLSRTRAPLFTFLPFLNKPSELRLVSVHPLWTTFYLTAPGALLFLP